MRFSKKLCVLMASVALAAVMPPALAQDTPANDDALREALRKTLQGDTPPSTQPATPTTPAPVTPAPVIVVPPTAPGTPATPPAVIPYTPGLLLTTNVTALGTGAVARLSLREVIESALVHNLEMQVQRYFPIIEDYRRRGLYGYYDPVFTSSVSREKSETESGGFNPNTGEAFPGTERETDSFSAGLGGYLPTGMRYDVGHNVNEVDARAPTLVDFLGTNILVVRRTVSWNSDALLSAQQPLLRNLWIDAPRLAIRQARRDLRISELTYERLVMDVLNRVEQAYYELIAARELIRVGESDVAVKKQFFDEQRRRVEVGTLAPLEEKLAQSELALAEINLIAYRRDAANAEAILKGLISDNFLSQLSTRIEPTDKLLSLPENQEIYDALREAVTKRPDLHAQRVELERRQIQLKFTFNQLFPSLDVFATYGANGLDRRLGGALDDIARREFPNHSYGLALSFPLSMHAERQQHKSAKASVEQQVLSFKQLEETVIQDVETQLRELRTAWNSIPLRREQVVYQQAALEAEQKKLAAGKSTSFNVLSIASALTAAQANEIGTLRDYNKAMAELAFRKGTTLERWKIDPPTRPNQ
jgi:outer membrane protein TolC